MRYQWCKHDPLRSCLLGFREATENEIIIPDIRLPVFRAMLEYLYTGVPPECLQAPPGRGTVVFLETSGVSADVAAPQAASATSGSKVAGNTTKFYVQLDPSTEAGERNLRLLVELLAVLPPLNTI